MAGARSMKVGLIGEAFTKDSGIGPWRYNYEVLSSLRKSKLDVHNVTSRPATRKYLFAINAFTRLPLKSLTYMKDVDIVHATDPSSAMSLPLLRKKTLVTIHDLISLLYTRQFRLEDRLFSRLVLSIAVRSTSIIASSQQTKAELIEYLHVPRNKIHVVNLGVSDSFRILPHVEKERACIGYVGKLTLRKRVDFLIRGFELFRRDYSPAAELVIAGSGEEAPRLKKLVRSLDLEDCVRFVGLVKEEDLVELYNSISVLVMPSDYEGFGFPIVEAQRCGTPVIIRRGTRISPEIASACLSVGSVEELASMLNDILSNPGRYSEVIRLGLENSKRFTWDKYLEELIGLYYQTLAKRTEPPRRHVQIPRLEGAVKTYFQRPGTVSQWWKPESGDTLFSDILDKEVELVTANTRRAIRVLDVGAGDGRVSVPLAGSGTKAISAVDISKEMLARIIKRTPEGSQSRIEIAQMDAESLAFADESFDAVTCIEALVHFPNPIGALKEFNRVLAKGGILEISVTLPVTLSTWLRHVTRISSTWKLKEWIFTPVYSSRLYRNLIRPMLGRPPPVSRDIPEKAVIQALEVAGFLVDQRKPLDSARNPRHLFLVARKFSDDRSARRMAPGEV